MIIRHYPTLELFIVTAGVAASILSERLLLPAALLTVIALAGRAVLDRGWTRTPADWAVAGLALMAPATLWASALPNVTLVQVYRLVTGIGLFYAVAGWATNARRWQVFLWAIPAASLVLVVYGLLTAEWILNKMPFLPESLYRFLPRWAADAIHPNILAGSLVILLPLCLAVPIFAWEEVPKGLRWLSVLASAAVMIMLGLSQSRGALLAAAASLAVIALLRWRRSWLVLLVLAAGLIGILSAFGPSLLLDSTMQVGEPVRKLEGRLEIWSRGIYMLQDFPLTGVGMGLYGPIADRIYPFFISMPGSVPHAHNLFLQVGVDLGIPGLVAWLGAFAAVSAASWSVIKATRSARYGGRLLTALGAGFLSSQAALAVHGLLDAATWGMVRPAPLVWGLWGAACAALITVYKEPHLKLAYPSGDKYSLQDLHPIDMLGVPVGRLNKQELIERLVQAAECKEHIITAYVNIHAVNLAQEQTWFKEYMQKADITFCDGFGIVLGARLLGERIPERFTPPDWLSDLAQAWTDKGLSMAFLGAGPGTAEQAADELSRRVPGMRVVYTMHGYFDKSASSEENRSIVEAINASGAELLVLGLGMPAQERWLMENWSRLTCRVALPIGAGFEYLGGKVPRAPRWMTDHGLEWLGRLAVEPGRLWKRYLVGIPVFFFRILRQRLSY